MPRGATDVALPHLQAWRMQNLKTQGELAKAAGVGLQTVVRAERGEQVRALSAHKLARALGITVRQLQNEEPG